MDVVAVATTIVAVTIVVATLAIVVVVEDFLHKK